MGDWLGKDRAPKAVCERENWNRLPNEIKLECIKSMDFETKTSLRCTASSEHKLVETQEHEFEYSELSCNIFRFNNALEFHIFKIENEESMEQMIPFISYVLSRCVIEEFTLKSDEKHPLGRNLEKIKELMEIKESKKIRVKRAHLNVSFETALFFLRMCWEKVDRIWVNYNHEIPIQEFFNLPQVLYARKVVILDKIHPMRAIFLVKKWIENGPKWCAKLNFHAYEQDSGFDQIVSEFENVKISHEGFKLRIKTNDSQMHIMIAKNRYSEFCCVVIPAKLPKEDFYQFVDFHSFH